MVSRTIRCSLPRSAHQLKRPFNGSLNAAPNTTFTIQFFDNASADPSGHGQGQNFLGSIAATTDSSGNLTFAATIPVSLTAGQFISAMATDPAGSTSESRQNVAVTSAASAVRGIAAASNLSSLDQAIETVSVGVIDDATLSPLAGEVMSRSAKRSH